MSERRLAIVTGASSGIGAETALELARRGYTVLLAARRRDRLEQVARECLSAGGQARVAVTDVSVQQQVDALVARAVEEFGRVDVMVNNAGAGLFARVHETTDERRGHIFNVSSVIGKRGVPFHGAYCATKFAICGLTDALRVEMKPYNVRVTCVCPALTATEFRVQARRAYVSFSTYKAPEKRTPPAVIARKIAATVGRSVPEIVFSPGGKFLCLLSALWPRAADALLKLHHDRVMKRLLQERTATGP
ncbi:MAG: hypothetical protein B1H04_04565 [Planctomycetales bacterium 4484_123]|nr:MAG: hypothetical protein B1H04_04565 [Planctomycetales bacterium 4484_123]